MASAITPSYSEARTNDESITAQDSEVIRGVKQTSLGNSYQIGDNSTVTDSGAFDMVKTIGSQLLDTIGSTTKSFANGVLNAANSIVNSPAVANEEAALTSQKNIISLLKWAVAGAAVVGIFYVSKKVK